MLKQDILLKTGIYESFTPVKTQTVRDLITELGLGDRYFGILVNGKKAGPNTVVKETDSVVILPHIAGGY